MRPAEWSLLVAVVALLLGIVTLVYAIRATRASERELELAEEQAALRPELEVCDVQLLGLRESEIAEPYVISYEQEKVQRELDRERGVQPTGPPPPDMVLRFKLANRGRAAATQAQARLYFDSAYLEPLNRSLDAARFNPTISEEPEAGRFRVRLGYPRTLFPGDETLSSDIAVSVRAAGKTSVRYELVSAEGGPPSKGAVGLEVPPPSERPP
jgi:hypothetical protein